MSNPKGILFKGEMVRAILEGRKTQTRRPVKFPADTPVNELRRGEDFMQNLRPMVQWSYFRKGQNVSAQGQECAVQVPYPWQVGDILYVKETWWEFGRWDQIIPHEGHFEGDMSWKNLSDKVEFAADHDNEPPFPNEKKIMLFGKWRKMASMFLKKKDARIWLKVTNVRVERLLGISEADAIAEGVTSFSSEKGLRWKCYESDPENHGFISARLSYLSLWDSINGAGSHKGNPFVVVLDFERIEKHS